MLNCESMCLWLYIISNNRLSFTFRSTIAKTNHRNKKVSIVFSLIQWKKKPRFAYVCIDGILPQWYACMWIIFGCEHEHVKLTGPFMNVSVHFCFLATRSVEFILLDLCFWYFRYRKKHTFWPISGQFLSPIGRGEQRAVDGERECAKKKDWKQKTFNNIKYYMIILVPVFIHVVCASET